MEPDHPLIIELDKKLKFQLSPEEEAKLKQMSKEAEQEFLSNPKKNDKRKILFEKNKK